MLRQAKLNTFEKDLDLTGDQFNVAVSILNVGYDFLILELCDNLQEVNRG